MSFACSIPGCNAGNDLTERIKLYRVPADAVENNALIKNFTKKRRIKWFNVLQNCGLTEENSLKFRVCSNHFVTGKPAPLFDNTHNDWAPSLYLSNSELPKAETSSGEGKKRKRGRPRKPSPTSNSRTKLVTCEISEDSDCKQEEPVLDQPFVFVDIHEIKEKDLTPKTPTPRVSLQKLSIKDGNRLLTRVRSCGTQTNPEDISSNCEISCKEENSATDMNEVQELYFGDIVDFIRSKMLDFNLKVLGNNYKIKECTIHFQKEGPNNTADDKNNAVTVLPKRLLSSNWSLLECLAKSLDLYRLQKRKNQIPTGYKQNIADRTEVIEKIAEVPVKSYIGNLRRICGNSPEKQAPLAIEGPTSPILPKITSVTSLSELYKNSPKKPAEEHNFSPKKLMKVCVPNVDSIPIVPQLVLKERGLNKEGLVNGTKKAVTTKNKALNSEKISEVQNKLGTVKVPRVILPILPDNLVQIAEEGRMVSVKEVAPYETKRFSPSVPVLLVPPNVRDSSGKDEESAISSNVGFSVSPSISSSTPVLQSNVPCGKKYSMGMVQIMSPSGNSPKGTTSTPKVFKVMKNQTRKTEGVRYSSKKPRSSIPSTIQGQQTPDCNICGRLFTNNTYLGNHLKSHQEFAIWTHKCSECPKKFPNKPELDEHFTLWHGGGNEYKTKHESNKCDDQLRTPETQTFLVDKAHESSELKTKKEEITKKPTAIRSKPPTCDAVELELRKLFQDNKLNLQESSDSEYEHEELLSEYKEPVAEEVVVKVCENKNKKRKRFRNLNAPDEEEDFEALIEPKICRVDKEQRSNDGNSKIETKKLSDDVEDGQIIASNIYFNRENMTDDLNHILIEELGESFENV